MESGSKWNDVSWWESRIWQPWGRVVLMPLLSYSSNDINITRTAPMHATRTPRRNGSLFFSWGEYEWNEGFDRNCWDGTCWGDYAENEWSQPQNVYWDRESQRSSDITNRSRQLHRRLWCGIDSGTTKELENTFNKEIIQNDFFLGTDQNVSTTSVF